MFLKVEGIGCETLWCIYMCPHPSRPVKKCIRAAKCGETHTRARTQIPKQSEGGRERARSDTNQSNYHFKKAVAPSERPRSFIETTQKNTSSGHRNASKVQAVISNTHTHTVRRIAVKSLCRFIWGINKHMVNITGTHRCDLTSRVSRTLKWRIVFSYFLIELPLNHM